MFYRIFTSLLLFFYYSASFSQVFVGLDAGPISGKSLEGYIAMQPKNEDWLMLSAGGGATLRAPFFLAPLKEDCLKKFRNGGWHTFISITNNLTDDHHKTHLFWGLKMVLAHHTEIAVPQACYPVQGTLDRRGWVLGGSVLFGYSVLLNKQSIEKNVFWDLGIQAGIPWYRQNEFLSPLNFISGLGYGKTGSPGINLGLIFAIRYELIHGKYGYSKPGHSKR